MPRKGRCGFLEFSVKKKYFFVSKKIHTFERFKIHSKMKWLIFKIIFKIIIFCLACFAAAYISFFIPQDYIVLYFLFCVLIGWILGDFLSDF